MEKQGLHQTPDRRDSQSTRIKPLGRSRYYRKSAQHGDKRTRAKVEFPLPVYLVQKKRTPGNIPFLRQHNGTSVVHFIPPPDERNVQASRKRRQHAGTSRAKPEAPRRIRNTIRPFSHPPPILVPTAVLSDAANTYLFDL